MVIVKGRNHNMADYYFRTEDLKVGYEGRALLEGIDICLGRGTDTGGTERSREVDDPQEYYEAASAAGRTGHHRGEGAAEAHIPGTFPEDGGSPDGEGKTGADDLP